MADREEVSHLQRAVGNLTLGDEDAGDEVEGEQDDVRDRGSCVSLKSNRWPDSFLGTTRGWSGDRAAEFVKLVALAAAVGGCRTVS